MDPVRQANLTAYAQTSGIEVTVPKDVLTVEVASVPKTGSGLGALYEKKQLIEAVRNLPEGESAC